MCLKGMVELYHIYSGLFFVRQLWSGIFAKFNISRCMPRSCAELLVCQLQPYRKVNIFLVCGPLQLWQFGWNEIVESPAMFTF